MSWLDRADEEIKIRSLLDRVGDPEAKTYVPRGEVVAVDRVFGDHGNPGRCEIRFLDRPYGADVDAPLEEQTIRTDWLSAAGWQGEVAREIERRATAAIGRRVRIHQFNEHAEGGMSDKGFRRVVWLEPVDEAPQRTEPAGPSRRVPNEPELDDKTRMRRALVDRVRDHLGETEKAVLREWTAAGGYPEKIADYTVAELESTAAKVEQLIEAKTEAERPF